MISHISVTSVGLTQAPLNSRSTTLCISDGIKYKHNQTKSNKSVFYCYSERCTYSINKTTVMNIQFINAAVDNSRSDMHAMHKLMVPHKSDTFDMQNFVYYQSWLPSQQLYWYTADMEGLLKMAQNSWNLSQHTFTTFGKSSRDNMHTDSFTISQLYII